MRPDPGIVTARPSGVRSPAVAGHAPCMAVLAAVLAGCSVAGTPRDNAPPAGSTAANGAGLSGEESFLACAGCHSLDPEDTFPMGPHLAGIVGRETAAVADHAYSAALSEASFVWDRNVLFSWIAAAESLLPGTHMLYHNHLEPDEVFRLIDFLEESGEPRAAER